MQRFTAITLAAVVGVLSLPATINLLSPDQRMNASFDRLHLVNTYGAFGSVNRDRYEIVIAGTRAEEPSARARWREYELPCKPGDVRRRPCLVSPWHYRLDWQMWFAGFSDPLDEPWILDVVWELLRGNRMVERLFARNPFPGLPPRWIRVERYHYRFASLSEHAREGVWWVREDVEEYVPTMSLDSEGLRAWEAERGR